MHQTGLTLPEHQGRRGTELAICLLGVCNLVRTKLLGGTSSTIAFKTLIVQIGKVIQSLRAGSLKPRSPGWQSPGMPPSWSWTAPLRAHLSPRRALPCSPPCLRSLRSCSPECAVILAGLLCCSSDFPHRSFFSLELSGLDQVLFCSLYMAALIYVHLVRRMGSPWRTVFGSRQRSRA